MDPRIWDKPLVVQTSFLGDTVLTLPLLTEIKRRFPDSKLSVLCTPVGQELLSGHPAVDEIIVDDKKKRDRGWFGLWRKAKLLGSKGFTMALCPHKSFRSGLLLFLARIPFRVGFAQSQSSFLFHVRVNRDAERHDVERTLSLLEALGIPTEECERALDLPIKSRGAGRSYPPVSIPGCGYFEDAGRITSRICLGHEALVGGGFCAAYRNAKGKIPL